MTTPGPGKFQANDSLEIAEALYRESQTGIFESFGDSSSGLGWYSLILTDEKEGFKPAYIVEEDTSGFFTYEGFDAVDVAKAKFQLIQEEHADDEEGDAMYQTQEQG